MEYTFTDADRVAGFPALIATLNASSTESLIDAYKRGMMPCFDHMFGDNAKVIQNQIAQALLRRNITEIPNILGPPIAVEDTW